MFRWCYKNAKDEFCRMNLTQPCDGLRVTSAWKCKEGSHDSRRREEELIKTTLFKQ